MPPFRELDWGPSRNGGRIYSTKKRTLWLYPSEAKLKHSRTSRRIPSHSARVLPQVRMSLAEWKRNADRIVSQILATDWGDGLLIARSSAADEDGDGKSLAGHYLSVAGVKGRSELTSAIEQVVASFDEKRQDHQVFVQPCLTDVAYCGVAFSSDPSTNAPYLVINYDTSGSTDSVTSGGTNELETCYCYRHRIDMLPLVLRPVGSLLLELLELLPARAIDIEFAINSQGNLYLLQVRPLVVANLQEPSRASHSLCLDTISKKVAQGFQRHPYLHGERTLYGVMPDWNPAEIIGIRPRPLALSLYKDLVTDSIWAYQRHNYGYRNLRSFPLIVDFYGLPYIDVRVSFNSFIPADIQGIWPIDW